MDGPAVAVAVDGKEDGLAEVAAGVAGKEDGAEVAVDGTAAAAVEKSSK